MPKKTDQFSVKLTSPDKVVLDGMLELKDEAFYLAFKNAEKDGLTKEQFFEKALRLGIYGYAEARISAFLHNAEKELDHGMENLKLIFRLKEANDNSTAKGTIMEERIKDVLDKFFLENGWQDITSEAGSDTGEIKDRKVGDIIVKVAGSDKKVSIESKFDKSVQLGDVLNMDYRKNKDPIADAEKTAFGQLLLSLANRDAKIALIVFDRATCHQSIRDLKQDVTFYPELPGWVVRIGKLENDFEPLKLAYSIARLQAISLERVSGENLDLVVKRILRDIDVLNKLEGLLKKIKDGAQQSIDGVRDIEVIIFQTKQSLVRTQVMLKNVLDGINPTAEQWSDFFKEPAVMA